MQNKKIINKKRCFFLKYLSSSNQFALLERVGENLFFYNGCKGFAPLHTVVKYATVNSDLELEESIEKIKKQIPFFAVDSAKGRYCEKLIGVKITSTLFKGEEIFDAYHLQTSKTSKFFEGKDLMPEKNLQAKTIAKTVRGTEEAYIEIYRNAIDKGQYERVFSVACFAPYEAPKFVREYLGL